MPRAKISQLKSTDLVFPTDNPNFTALVASDLGGGFTLTDDFDALMLALTTNVAADMNGLGDFDLILNAIDDGDGAVADGTVDPIIQNVASASAASKPASDALTGSIGTYVS